MITDSGDHERALATVEPAGGEQLSTRWQAVPLTVEQVSLVLGVRQAFVDSGGIDSVAFAQAWPLEFNAMSAMDDPIQDRVAESGIAEHVEMPQRLTVESLGSG